MSKEDAIQITKKIITNADISKITTPQQPENKGFALEKAEQYNYFSICRCEQINNPIAAATPLDTSLFTSQDPFRDIFFDEFWIRITGIWAAPAAVVYPAHSNTIGVRVLVNGIIMIPDIRTAPFPIDPTVAANGWIHPTEEWAQVLHPKNPIKVSNGDVVVIQWFNVQAHGAVILNTMWKGHMEPVRK